MDSNNTGLSRFNLTFSSFVGLWDFSRENNEMMDQVDMVKGDPSEKRGNNDKKKGSCITGQGELGKINWDRFSFQRRIRDVKP